MKALKILVLCVGFILGWNLIPSENDNNTICMNRAVHMYKACDKNKGLLQYKPGTCAKAYNKSLRYCDLIFKE